jgi:glycosyltransferase involved in cell wall biosynthesis
MKVGVYNRHWPTMGGGEKYGGGIAQVLSTDHEVDVLAHEPLDLTVFGERLQLDLSNVNVAVIDDTPGSVAEASRDYDLFINTSYLSSDLCYAPQGIYVVHFPTPLGGDVPAWRRSLSRAARPLLQRVDAVPFEFGTGFYPKTSGRLRSTIWTDGRGELFVHQHHERPAQLSLLFGRVRPRHLGPVRVRIEVDGCLAHELDVTPATNRLSRATRVVVDLPARRDGRKTSVVVHSDTFVPSEHGLGSDNRRLGVPLAAVRAGSRPSRWVQAVSGPLGLSLGGSFVSTYTVVVSNAAFTQHFVREWWGVDSTVLYPPVSMQKVGEKDNLILSVGRFFPADRGHSKKQLEMVRVFRALYDQGLRGWELHLVGGCSADGADYLAEVRAAAADLPVVFHIGASGAELADLYRRAAIFWSATGLGEDAATHPVRFEHFGITTVEAMSAGAVPIVLAGGGQVEIVRDGIDGYHFSDEAGLAARTRLVTDDDQRRADLARAAHDRAQDFSMDRFGERLRTIVDAAMRHAEPPAVKG